MPFPYYRRLSRADQAAYRKSDAQVTVYVPDPRALRPLLSAVEAALAADDRAAVEKATKKFIDALLVQLKAPPVVTKVLARRPADEGGELHGLYEIEEEGAARPRLRVWMRTAAQKRPVAFRTFVRTVLHEVCHHLDFTVLGLEPSFHTEGFFKRESHMTRQLLGAPRPRGEPPKQEPRQNPAPKQMDLL
jgi:hypothetical protein